MFLLGTLGFLWFSLVLLLFISFHTCSMASPRLSDSDVLTALSWPYAQMLRSVAPQIGKGREMYDHLDRRTCSHKTMFSILPMGEGFGTCRLQQRTLRNNHPCRGSPNTWNRRSNSNHIDLDVYCSFWTCWSLKLRNNDLRVLVDVTSSENCRIHWTFQCPGGKTNRWCHVRTKKTQHIQTTNKCLFHFERVG